MIKSHIPFSDFLNENVKTNFFSWILNFLNFHHNTTPGKVNNANVGFFEYLNSLDFISDMLIADSGPHVMK